MKIKSLIVCIMFLSVSSPSLAQKIGVISALPEEQRSFLENVDNNERITKSIVKGDVGKHTVFATLSGIGKVNAASVAQELISRYNVDILLFTGVAGGINPTLNIGDVVVASLAFQHDYGYLGKKFSIHAIGTVPEIGIGSGDETIYFDLTQNWDQETYDKLKEIFLQSTSLLTQVNVGGNKYAPKLRMNGIIATGDQFVASESKKEVLKKLKADVVEMEGAAVAQVAMKNGIPVLIVRSVSDKAGEKAKIDFKSFFSTVAHNNTVLILRVIKAIP